MKYYIMIIKLCMQVVLYFNKFKKKLNTNFKKIIKNTYLYQTNTNIQQYEF